MRNLFFFSIWIIVQAYFSTSSASSVDSLLHVLDQTIVNHDLYTNQKENNIKSLQIKRSRSESESIERYDINTLLFDEYHAYVCDSAILYLNENIEIVSKCGDIDKLNKTKLDLSYLLASSGMYKEAIDILETIDRDKLDDKFLNKYYTCVDRAYGEMSFYTQDKVASNRYWRISQAYRDSMNNSLNPQSNEYLQLQETIFRDDHKFDKAIEINNKYFLKEEFGTPQYALAAYFRSLIFQKMGDVDSEKYYLALSAISDIQSAIKDHASLWMLAQLLYNEGEVERAYRYMRFSWKETKQFNARLRSWQSADVLSLIDKTYQAMIEKQNQRLEQYASLITILLVLLLGALIYIYRQMKKLSVARNSLQDANVKLNTLNEELKQMNECLKNINIDLSESNHIKEEYIARFVKLCSLYIDKLDAYRRMVHKKLIVGQSADLLKMTRSQEALNKELEELYENFDSAFLHIFPNFVSQFNDLLIDEEHILLKRGELLNTELRIFALIRLGIEDSSQIAEFLRYSVNTIYNYRSRVKNKSKVSRDDFEEFVKEIR